MLKRPDTKTRKKLRIAMCVMFLVQEVICTMPFIQDTKFNADGLVTMASPYNLFLLLFGVTSGLPAGTLPICIIGVALILIPIICFFFCALDKERNLKNIVSVIGCITGVALTVTLTSGAQVVSIGAILALLLYVLIMFITSVAMVMRLSKDEA